MRYCTLNLNDLSLDLAREYVTETLIETGFPLTNDFTAQHRREMLQKTYQLSDSPVRSTIWEWLTCCGFSYKPRRVRFYVDSHESPANRKYRKHQTARYLRRERRMHRWYQLTEEEVLKLVETKKILLPGRGFRYEAEGGKKMVELHIDDISSKELLTKIYSECPFGGNLSVQKLPEERPLISFGHDECIFRQFVFSGSAWQGTKGEQGIIPKDEGYGLMVSAFKAESLALGFHLPPPNSKLLTRFGNQQGPIILKQNLQRN